MTDVTSLGVALVLCMLGQVTGMPNQCGVDARPHSEGICGDMLLRARAQLCFLLYTDYPDHFHPGKRSVDNLFDLPVEAFAKMHMEGDDLDDATDQPMSSANDKFAFLPMLLSKAQSAGRTLEAQRARIPQIKRAEMGEITSVQKRGLVCDCCYNKCRPSVLARYC